MEISEKQQQQLRRLPGVDALLLALADGAEADRIPKTVLVGAVRSELDACRQTILNSPETADAVSFSQPALLTRIVAAARRRMALNLRRVINATGVIVHTNLGRSLLADAAIANMAAVAAGYSNLEYDLSAGRRGSRYTAVEDILCEISGAEAAMVVNNNAGAVLLCLATVAEGREVVVSRGELVEIGGSFRVPDIIARSGCILKEVGTTNRTHPNDYERAIGENSALLLKVHQSNYAIVGFSADVPLPDLVSLGKKHHMPVMDDLGSGTFIDLSAHGLAREPTVQETVATGVDLATFSGDKLLGGPQAGIIVGRKKYIEQIKKNPLTRALRIDKLTLAALESTLHLYRDPERALSAIPTLKMLTMSLEVIDGRARQLSMCLEKIADPRLHVQVTTGISRAGGGSLPLQNLESRCVAIQIDGRTVQSVERALRASRPPVIGRIEDGLFLMDVRTLPEDEFDTIAMVVSALLKKAEK